MTGPGLLVALSMIWPGEPSHHPFVFLISVIYHSSHVSMVQQLQCITLNIHHQRGTNTHPECDIHPFNTSFSIIHCFPPIIMIIEVISPYPESTIFD